MKWLRTVQLECSCILSELLLKYWAYAHRYSIVQFRYGLVWLIHKHTNIKSHHFTQMDALYPFFSASNSITLFEWAHSPILFKQNRRKRRNNEKEPHRVQWVILLVERKYFFVSFFFLPIPIQSNGDVLFCYMPFCFLLKFPNEKSKTVYSINPEALSEFEILHGECIVYTFLNVYI